MDVLFSQSQRHHITREKGLSMIEGYLHSKPTNVSGGKTLMSTRSAQSGHGSPTTCPLARSRMQDSWRLRSQSSRPSRSCIRNPPAMAAETSSHACTQGDCRTANASEGEISALGGNVKRSASTRVFETRDWCVCCVANESGRMNVCGYAPVSSVGIRHVEGLWREHHAG